ncbi:MAG: hypothetical protein EA364_14680 [Balneolaceae bacterium]|nr:MAG: hypothetical protein EA364_14680 [Balneolaceae bacterium]
MFWNQGRDSIRNVQFSNKSMFPPACAQRSEIEVYEQNIPASGSLLTSYRAQRSVVEVRELCPALLILRVINPRQGLLLTSYRAQRSVVEVCEQCPALLILRVINPRQGLNPGAF